MLEAFCATRQVRDLFGIPTLEDKELQRAVLMVREAVYEQHVTRSRTVA